MMNAYTDEYYEYTPRRMGKGERLSRAREIEKIECKIDELRREIQNLKEKSQKQWMASLTKTLRQPGRTFI